MILKRGMESAIPTLVHPLPAEWPLGYDNARNNLGSLLAHGPRYEESWNGDVLSMFIHMFPVSAPENYVIKSQCNLRKPANPPAEENQDPTGPRASIESRGHQTAHSRTDGNHEGEILRPDFVIDNGTRDTQRLVAVIELKQSQFISRRDREQFAKYCHRVTQYNLSATAGASALLIAGGVAYAWNRDQIGDISLGPILSDQMLEQSNSANVDTVDFLQILAMIRNRFVQSLPNNHV